MTDANPDQEPSEKIDRTTSIHPQKASEAQKEIKGHRSMGDTQLYLDEATGVINSIGTVDRYRILQKIGQGGFGAVYWAEDTVGKIHVAVKVLPPLVSHNHEELEGVQENFSIVSRVHHQNIANLLHLHEVKNCDAKADSVLGLVKGDFLMVMEYVPGVTLSKYRKSSPEKRVTADEAILICSKIADALDYAHSKKIVHRDIKSSNVMITPDNEIKVLDFGIAAEIRSSLSRVSTESPGISGTYPYMSPEQWRGEPQDGRADQYSLAVLFYELVNEEVPFASLFSTNDVRLMRDAVENNKPKSLSELSSGQNKALLRALSKKQADRFPTCGDFVSALKYDKMSILGLNWPVYLSIFAAILGIGLGIFFMLNRPQEVSVSTANAPSPSQSQQKESNSVRDPSESPKSPPSPDEDLEITETESIHPTSLSEDFSESVTPIKQEAELKWQKVMTISRDQNFGETLDELKIQLHSANSLFDAKNYSEALKIYRNFLNDCTRIQFLDKKRDEAAEHRMGVIAEKQLADKANTSADASDLWQRSEFLLKSGDKSFANSDFKKAIQIWEQAKGEYQKAVVYASEIRALRKAKSGYHEVLSKTDARIVKEFGGDYWRRAAKIVRKAEKFERIGRFNAAAKEWNQAADALPETIRYSNKMSHTAKANIAKKSRDWQLVLQHAKGALKIDSGFNPAKELANEAKEQLKPKLQIISIIDGQEVDGAEIYVNGVEMEDKTPATFSLDEGKGHQIKVSFKSRNGIHYRPFEKHVDLEVGSTQVLSATLIESKQVIFGQARTVPGLGIELIPIEAGNFQMGTPNLRKKKVFDEKQHSVTITKGFWIGKYEITLAVYESLIGKKPIAKLEWEKVFPKLRIRNPISKPNVNKPIAGVNWNEAVSFCRKLTVKEQEAGRLPSEYVYRLPTEAEWEYCCRGGTTGDYAGELNRMGWFKRNSAGRVHETGEKNPNPWGLYDMHGNVWEWCLDHSDNARNGIVTDTYINGIKDPLCLTGSRRIIRGGGWRNKAESCRSANRRNDLPTGTSGALGFRIVLASVLR